MDGASTVPPVAGGGGEEDRDRVSKHARRRTAAPGPWMRAARLPGLRLRTRTRGQSLVEAALALPIVLVLALGIIDGGRVFSARENVTNAARQALRVAVSQERLAANVCEHNTYVGGPTMVPSNGAIPAAAGDPVAAAAEVESKDSSGNSRIKPATVAVLYHCLLTNPVTNTTATSTDPTQAGSAAVSVTVCYQFQPFMPLVKSLFGGDRLCPSHPPSLGGISISTAVLGRVQWSGEGEGGG